MNGDEEEPQMTSPAMRGIHRNVSRNSSSVAVEEAHPAKRARVSLDTAKAAASGEGSRSSTTAVAAVDTAVVAFPSLGGLTSQRGKPGAIRYY